MSLCISSPKHTDLVNLTLKDIEKVWTTAIEVDSKEIKEKTFSFGMSKLETNHLKTFF